jgi:hypothetical protein
MKKTFIELIKRAEAYVGLYQGLSDLLDEEHQALLARDLKTAQKLGRTKLVHTQKIETEAALLADSICRAARRVGMDADPPPALAELARRAPKPARPRLARAGWKLARLKREVAAKNETSRTFVNESLRILSGSLSILTGAVALEKPGYSQPGIKKRRPETKPVRLNREV